MARPQKYGLPTTGIKVPVELKDTIVFICFKYGELDEKRRIEYIEQLNEEVRKDSVKKCDHNFLHVETCLDKQKFKCSKCGEYI